MKRLAQHTTSNTNGSKPHDNGNNPRIQDKIGAQMLERNARHDRKSARNYSLRKKRRKGKFARQTQRYKLSDDEHLRHISKRKDKKYMRDRELQRRKQDEKEREDGCRELLVESL